MTTVQDGTHLGKSCHDVHRATTHDIWLEQYASEELHPGPMGLQKGPCLEAHPGRRHLDWLERELEISALAQSERSPASTYELIEGLEEQDPVDWFIQRTEKWLKVPDRAQAHSNATRKPDHEELVVLMRASSIVAKLKMSGGPRWNEWWVTEVKISDSVSWTMAKKVHAACVKLGITIA